MKEFKCRVWDEMLNDMFIVTKLFEGKAIEGIRVGTKKDYKLISANSKVMLASDVKDKNGVEIYKSDIIKMDLGIGVLNVEVDFIEGCFVLMLPDGSFDKFCKEVSRFEVVGNIYQNKELLKDEV